MRTIYTEERKTGRSKQWLTGCCILLMMGAWSCAGLNMGGSILGGGSELSQDLRTAATYIDDAAEHCANAAVHLGAGQYQQAIAEATKAIDLAHDARRLGSGAEEVLSEADAVIFGCYTRRAEANFRANRYWNASFDYESAIEWAPGPGDIPRAALRQMYNMRDQAILQVGKPDRILDDQDRPDWAPVEPQYRAYAEAQRDMLDDVDAYARENDWADGVEYMDGALGVQTQAGIELGIPEIYYWRGYFYLRWGKLGAAVGNFTKAIELSQDDNTYYAHRGNAYWSLEEFAMALSDYDQALVLNDEHWEVYVWRGTLRTHLGDPQAAIADYERALAGAPADWWMRPHAEDELKKAREAVPAPAQQARASEPVATPVAQTRPSEPAEVATEPDAYAGAAGDAAASPASDEAPAALPFHLQQARAHLEAREHWHARLACNRAIARAGEGLSREDVARAYELRDIASLQLGLYADLLDDPNRPWRSRPASRLAALAKEQQQAVELLMGFVENSDWSRGASFASELVTAASAERVEYGMPFLIYWRGYMNFMAGNYAQALEDYSRAVDLSRNQPVYYYRLGAAHARAGNPAAAIVSYDRSLALDATRWQAYVGRADVYAGRGRLDEAIADYERALRGAPADWQMRAYTEKALSRALRVRSQLGIGSAGL